MVQVKNGKFAGRTGHIVGDKIVIFNDTLKVWIEISVDVGYDLA